MGFYNVIVIDVSMLFLIIYVGWSFVGVERLSWNLTAVFTRFFGKFHS